MRCGMVTETTYGSDFPAVAGGVLSEAQVEELARAQGQELTPLQRFFLYRLASLLSRRMGGEPLSPLQQRLLDRAIYSVYLDCRQQGVEETARRLLDVARQQAATVNRKN